MKSVKEVAQVDGEHIGGKFSQRGEELSQRGGELSQGGAELLLRIGELSQRGGNLGWGKKLRQGIWAGIF